MPAVSSRILTVNRHDVLIGNTSTFQNLLQAFHQVFGCATACSPSIGHASKVTSRAVTVAHVCGLIIPDREGDEGLGVLGRRGSPGPAEAELCLLFSPLLFYEFSIKAPPESPPGVQRLLLTESGGLDAPRVELHTFSYAWIASAVQRGRSQPNRSQIAAVFHFGIEIFLLSKCPCSTFPELCACARWLIFMHEIVGRDPPRALHLTSSWPPLQP